MCVFFKRGCSRQIAGALLLVWLQVRAHEPWLALDGGDGLGTDALDAVCSGAVALLRPGGFLALETAGGEQAHAVAATLRMFRADGGNPAAVDSDGAAGSDGGQSRDGGSADEASATADTLAFSDVEVVSDCFGVDRFVTASRSSAS